MGIHRVIFAGEATAKNTRYVSSRNSNTEPIPGSHPTDSLVNMFNLNEVTLTISNDTPCQTKQSFLRTRRPGRTVRLRGECDLWGILRNSKIEGTNPRGRETPSRNSTSHFPNVNNSRIILPFFDRKIHRGLPRSVQLKRKAAKILTHVTSDSKHFPFCHGTKVKPSGLLLSVRQRTGGSRTQRMLADIKALFIGTLEYIFPCDLLYGTLEASNTSASAKVPVAWNPIGENFGPVIRMRLRMPRRWRDGDLDRFQSASAKVPVAWNPIGENFGPVIRMRLRMPRRWRDGDLDRFQSDWLGNTKKTDESQATLTI
ncbi:hypothetical protein MSG28_007743 [Choristoneura fumiferana]|uniref:Uncharacterized protein n=1 Tax=Choristoneura fumiferana TaxID=7141 RepID=A0ACC0JZ40_CHOFU|nr:hypothetical protein MSG28_007743 [Choristoneura fumiferana]